MAFTCVNGSRECDGCMACQSLPTHVEIALGCATRFLDNQGKNLKAIKIKLEEIVSRLEEMRGNTEEAMDDIPEGYEDSSEYSSLEHNLDAIDSALDYLTDVQDSVESMI